VLICGLFGGIGAWSISSRVQRSDSTTYRFASLPKGAYLMEATRTAGGVDTPARTQQLWKDPQGRYVLLTVTHPDTEESQYLHQIWTGGGLPRNVFLSLLGVPKQDAFVGKPSPRLLSEKSPTNRILAEWTHLGVFVDVERGSTVFNNPSAYFLAESDGTMPSQAESVQRGKADLAANADFQTVLEQLRLVDKTNPMLGMVLPNGFSLVDEVVNPTRTFRSVETTDMWVKLKSGEVVRTSIYRGPRRTLTLPKAAQEPMPYSYPIVPTGLNFSGEKGQQIDMQIPPSYFTGTSSESNDELLVDLQHRLQLTERKRWRAWADASIRRDLEVFERKVWNGMPIFLAWRKSARSASSTAVEVCLGPISSTSCTMLDGEPTNPAPFFAKRLVLLADGRWVVLQKVSKELVDQTPEQPTSTGERLPFDVLWVNAVEVPNDQITYRDPDDGFGRSLFRPLR
jgi:hypothetical protein